MFQNCRKNGDCYVGIRTVGITIYLLIAQSIPMYLLQSISMHLQCTSYTVNSNLLIAQSIPMYLLHNQFQFTYL